MREVPALIGRHLRSAFRSRRLRVLVVSAGLLLAFAAAATTASSRILLGFVVVGVLAFGAAAWAGGLLPADRRAGRAAWLATLAPPPTAHRAAAALAGVMLALLVATVGSLLFGVVVWLVEPDLELRAATAQPHLTGLRLEDPRHGGRPTVVPIVWSPEDDQTLEVRFRVRFASFDDTASAVRVGHELGGGRTVSEELAYRAPYRLALPGGVVGLRLANQTPGTVLVVREARVLGERRVPLTTFLLAGLLLGFAAGALAPLSVAVSRWTSGPTASAAVLVVALAAAVYAVVSDVVLVRADELHALGLDVVAVGARLAPDLAALGLLGEPAAGRALEPGAVLERMVPLALYTLATLGLALVPLPGRRVGEVRE